MEEIDLRSLFRIMITRWWVIVICTVVCTSVSVIVSYFVLKPVYQSSTTLYIGKNIDVNSDINYNDVLLGTQLVKDYREIAKSRLISAQVIKDMGLKNLTPEGFSNKIEVNLKNDTRVIQITAEDRDPAIAQKIANNVAEVFKQKVVVIMQVENVQTIDVAEAPINPIKPNKRMNIAIAFVLGFMLGAGIIFLIEYLDTTVKTPEDVKRITQLPVIGIIPVFPE
jgi:capsular polysaccharide biosynthesis protein